MMRRTFLKTSTLSIVTWGAVVHARANPLAVALVEKTWERCLIGVGAETATVSCAVGYVAKGPLQDPLSFSVPVIWPKALAQDPDQVIRDVDPRLELEGVVHRPKRVQFVEDASLPEGMRLAQCRFNLGGAPAPQFAIVVTYEQPLIRGLVAYLPQFEEGKNPASGKEFSISLFPQGGGELALVSKHEAKATTMATRITIQPRHKELVLVRSGVSGAALKAAQ
jgi:hypothetical protein